MVLLHSSGVYQLFVQLRYGSGFRLIEELHLRVKRLIFAQQQIVLREAKGNESRVTLPMG